jgi:ferredoxin
MACPREALHAWGHVHIDSDRCSDCYGGIHQFEENRSLKNRDETLDIRHTLWRRACVENCPVEALSIEQV